MENAKPIVTCGVCSKPGAYLWNMEIAGKKIPVHRGCGDTAKAFAPAGKIPRIRPSEWKTKTDQEAAAKNFWAEKFNAAEVAAAKKGATPTPTMHAM